MTFRRNAEGEETWKRLCEAGILVCVVQKGINESANLTTG
jgi:hypothetical protein